MPKRILTQQEVADKFRKHKEWLASNHERGEQADFSDCDLRPIRRIMGKSAEASFVMDSMKFNRTNFSGLDIGFTSFQNCELQHADFSSARFYEAEFARSDLTGTEFLDAKMRESLFEKNRMHESAFKEAWVFQSAFLTNSVSRANLSDATLERCLIQQNSCREMTALFTKFKETTLRENVFDSCRFMQCDFSGALISNCEIIKGDYLDNFLEKCRLHKTALQKDLLQMSIPLGDAQEKLSLACDLKTGRIYSKQLNPDGSIAPKNFLQTAAQWAGMHGDVRKVTATLKALDHTLQEACRDYKKKDFTR